MRSLSIKLLFLFGFTLFNATSVGTTAKCRTDITSIASSDKPTENPLYVHLTQHGDFTLAYSSSSQPKMHYFATEDGVIPYQKRLWRAFVPGDPLVAPEKKEALLRAFLKAHPRAVFVQISEGTAQELSKLGYYVNEMGLDFKIDLQTYDFKGKKKERLRAGANRLKKKGFTVVEHGVDEIVARRMRSISSEWLQARGANSTDEVPFLNRPPVFADEVDVRKFFVYNEDGQLVAFYVFDPIYRDGKVIGYSLSTKRKSINADLRTEEGVTKIAIETFQKEGLEIFKLGLAPLAKVEKGKFRDNRFARGDFRRAFNSNLVNNFLYPLRNHFDLRQRYQAEEEKTYFASPRLIYTLDAIGLAKLLHIPLSPWPIIKALFGSMRKTRPPHREGDR